ncbi:MAG TPA: ABC transporter permease [Devosiaceae bacterium]
MGSVFRRFTANRLGTIAAIYVATLVLVAIAAQFSGIDPTTISNTTLAPPSAAHWLGTDELGRDVLTGLVFGIQVSLVVGFVAALAATTLGILIGGLAGFFGGILDIALMRLTELFQVIPTFILAAVVVALSGTGLTRVIIVIAILAWPQPARVMRGEVMRIKQLEFVEAVRCLGYREARILFTEVIPNALSPALAVGTLLVGQAILLEAALSYFGLGSPEVISWGRMLNSGQRFLSNAWWLSFFPGIAIAVTILAFNLVGDAIARALNSRATP